jgi:hypothetical protein
MGVAVPGDWDFHAALAIAYVRADPHHFPDEPV